MTTFRRPFIILVIVCTTLLIPLIAMQFSSEVNWSLFDFLVAGALLSAVGFAINFVIGKTKSENKRWLWIIAIAIAFLLIWAELAVGVFGTPFAGS